MSDAELVDRARAITKDATAIVLHWDDQLGPMTKEQLAEISRLLGLPVLVLPENADVVNDDELRAMGFQRIADE